MADPKVGMSNYTPQPEYKFTFGLWTVGKIGHDPLIHKLDSPFPMFLFLGLDSSTLTKVVTIDETRSMAVSVAHPCETPRPQWSEQHPDLLRRAAVKNIRQVCTVMSRTVRHDLVAGWTV